MMQRTTCGAYGGTVPIALVALAMVGLFAGLWLVRSKRPVPPVVAELPALPQRLTQPVSNSNLPVVDPVVVPAKAVPSAADAANGTAAVTGVWVARDAIRQWNKIASSADGTKLAATVYGGQIYLSTDSGESWTASESVRNWGSVTSSADGMKLMAAVPGGQIYTYTAASAVSSSTAAVKQLNDK